MPKNDDWFAYWTRGGSPVDKLHFTIMNNRADFSRDHLNVKNKKWWFHAKLKSITPIASG